MVRARFLIAVVATVFVLGGSIGWVGAMGGTGPHLARSTGGVLDAAAFGTTYRTTTVSAGYAVPTAATAVTDVRADWHVPQIAAPCPSSGNTYSSFYIGIDGYSSTTLEEVGTETYCLGGTAHYAAYYELYPTYGAYLGLKISPADAISAEVSYHAGTFTFKLKDVSTGKSFSKSITYAGTHRSSAEWIAAASYSGSTVYPLTDFGWVTFTNTNATVSGHTHPVGGFANVALKMVSLVGSKVMASDGSLTSGGSVFRVNWKYRGP